MQPYIMNGIGVLAGTGTTISFFPQVIRMYRTTDVSGVSVYMFIVHFSGACLWVLYGIFQSDMIIISFNIVTIILILACLVRYWHVSCSSVIPL